MQCLSCHADNREGRRYCSACGVALPAHCDSCGFVNEPGEDFCGGCGKSLAPAPAATGPAQGSDPATVAGGQSPPVARPHTAERRQVTVVFCDIAGSTKLSEQLDPEELRQLLAAYRGVVSEAVLQFDGFVGGFAGDGVLVYFGYPRAHENDAQRAVLCSLEIVRQVNSLITPDNVEIDSIAVRIGVATGLVVVGGASSEDMRDLNDVVGEAPNLGARLQEVSELNGIVICPTTKRLVEGMFLLKDLGARSLKGFSEPIHAYQVVAETDTPRKFDADAKLGLTPMVGREAEISLLRIRWEQALKADAQTVLVIGEAGVGKSRILHGFQDGMNLDMLSRVTYLGSPFHQHSAFFPAIEQLRRAFQLAKDDDDTTQLRKIRSVLRAMGIDDEKPAAVFATLLDLPLDAGEGLTDDPQRRRLEILGAFLAVFEVLARRKPVLVIVEDAQWIDPSTIELLRLLVQELHDRRILFVITYRPEIELEWDDNSNVTALRLNRLSTAETSELISIVAGGRTLPPNIVDQIALKTDGVPLFIEELTKTILESGELQEREGRYDRETQAITIPIPESLHDSLLERLDRLLPVKAVAQQAATIGRTFSMDLLQAISDQTPAQLEVALSELVEAGLVYRRGLPQNQIYEFKHALVRDAAYQSLLRATRRSYHNTIAEVLERRFPEVSRAQPELVATHFQEAGNAQQALRYWKLAGEQSRRNSANIEAIVHFGRALRMLDALPVDDEHKREELQIRVNLNGPLIAAKGYSAPELEDNFRHALELRDQVADPPDVYPMFYAKWVYLITTGQFHDGLTLGHSYLDSAEAQGDDLNVMVGHRLLGPAYFITGHFGDARAHLQQAIDRFDPLQHRELAILYGQDVKAASLCYLSLTEWHLGNQERALALADQVLAWSASTSHSHTYANAVAHAGAFLNLLCRRPAVAQPHATTLLKYAEDHSLPIWAAMGRAYLGWAKLQDGTIDGAAQLIGDGLAGLEALGFVYWRPLLNACLAEAHARQGALAEADNLLRDAVDIIERTGERWYEAEIYRLRGEIALLIGENRKSEAEDLLRRALAIARQQGALSWELRTATTLSGCLATTGRLDEARELLTGCIDKMAEGDALPDYQNALACRARLEGREQAV